MSREGSSAALGSGGYFLLTTLLLMAPALFNGYPLLYSDSGTYILSSFSLDAPVDRPIGYGLFLRPFTGTGTLWTVVFAQSLIINLLLYRVAMVALPGTRVRWVHLPAVVVLVAFSSLAWYTSQVMPDWFSGVLLLIAFLFLTGEHPRRWYGALLLLGWFLANITHHSHYLLAMALLASLVFWACFRVKSRMGYGEQARRAIILGAVTAASILFLAGYNAVSGLGFRPTPASNVFLAARLAQTGLLQAYLDESCETREHALCSLRDEFPREPWRFLWPDDGVLATVYRDQWAAADQDLAPLVRGVLAEPKYLTRFVRHGLLDSARQLTKVRVGSGIGPYPEDGQPRPAFREHFGHERDRYLRGRQQRGALGFSRLNLLQPALLSLSVIVLLWAAWRRPARGRPLTLLILIACLGVLLNALITGSLNGPAPRLQARITWVLVFAALVCLAPVVERRLAGRWAGDRSEP